MRRILFLVFLLALSEFSSGQNAPESPRYITLYNEAEKLYYDNQQSDIKDSIALSLYLKVIDLHPPAADSILSDSYFKAGSIYLEDGKDSLALVYLLKTNYNHQDKFNHLGMAFSRLNMMDSALAYYKKAADLNGKVNGNSKNIQFAITCKNLGDHYYATENYDSALSNYQLAIIQLVIDFDDDDIRINPSSFTGQYSVIELFEALSAKARTLTVRYHHQHKKNDLLSSIYAYEALFKLVHYVIRTYSAEKAKLLLTNKKHLLHSEPIEVSLKMFELTGDSVYLRHAFRFDEKNKSTRLALHIREPELQFTGNTIDLKSLQRIIPDDYAVLSYHLGDTSMISFAITKNTFSHATNKIDGGFRKSIEGLFQLIQLTDRNVNDQIDKMVDSLYKKLIAPFSEEISGVKHLMVIPDDGLAYLPFEILKTGNESKLVDKYSITYNYSCSLLKVQDQKNKGTGLLVRGEGLMNLNRSFSYACCQNTVASLWRADDKTTAKISELFHKQLKNGKTIAEALQLAKINYLKENIPDKLKSPAYWAHLRFTGTFEKESHKSRAYIFILIALVIAGITIYFSWRRRS